MSINEDEVMNANSTDGYCTGETSSVCFESYSQDKKSRTETIELTRKPLKSGFFIVPLLLLGLALAPAPAVHAGSGGAQCLKQKTGLNNPSCTAADVRLSELRVISGPPSCTLGENINVTMEATIESGPDRYDVGLWINEVGGLAKDDPDGTCFREYLHPLANPRTSCQQQGGPYWSDPTEPSADICGDVYASGTNPCGNKVTGPCTGGGGGPVSSPRLCLIQPSSVATSMLTVL